MKDSYLELTPSLHDETMASANISPNALHFIQTADVSHVVIFGSQLLGRKGLMKVPLSVGQYVS